MNAFVRLQPHWWQWPTVLSLDAPAVALLWQWLLAHLARATLGWYHAFVLGSSVWLAYVLDRWIEGWRLSPDQVRTERHTFYQRRRWPVAIVWLILLGADISVALTHLSAREWDGGWILLVSVTAYLLSHQWVHRHRRWRAPKEICVAALLGGGVALFLVAPSPFLLRPLAAPLALFMLLCFANCALISTWERDVDATHGQTSLALQFQRAVRYRGALPWITAALTALFAVSHPDRATGIVAACAMASSLLLGIINRLQPRMGRQLARVLADVALMTPCVPLLGAWLR
jgi:hypothetical protein